jgi:serine/threonine protein kinase
MNDDDKSEYNIDYKDESEITPIVQISDNYYVPPTKQDFEIEQAHLTKTGMIIPIIDLTIENENYFWNLYKDFYKKYGAEIFKYLPKNTQIIRQIGQGAFGDIYAIRYPHDDIDIFKDRVIKIEKMNNLLYDSKDIFHKKIRNEYEIQTILCQDNPIIPPYALCPEKYIFFDYNYNYYSIITMYSLLSHESTISEILQLPNLPNKFFIVILTKIAEFINKLCQENIIHGDLRWENIYITLDIEDEESIDIQDWTQENVFIGLLDFGWSLSNIKCDPEFELLSLLRNSYSTKYPKQNRDRIQQILKQILIQNNYTQKHTLKDYYTINNRYNELFKEHVKKYIYVKKE